MARPTFPFLYVSAFCHLTSVEDAALVHPIDRKRAEERTQIFDNFRTLERASISRFTARLARTLRSSQVSGPFAPAVPIAIQAEVARLEASLGNLSSALELAAPLPGLAARSLGPLHPLVTYTCCTLAQSRALARDYAAAIDALLQAREITEEIEGRGSRARWLLALDTAQVCALCKDGASGLDILCAVAARTPRGHVEAYWYAYVEFLCRLTVYDGTLAGAMGRLLDVTNQLTEAEVDLARDAMIAMNLTFADVALIRQEPAQAIGHASIAANLGGPTSVGSLALAVALDRTAMAQRLKGHRTHARWIEARLRFVRWRLNRRNAALKAKLADYFFDLARGAEFA